MLTVHSPSIYPEAPAAVATVNVQRNMKQLTAANVTRAANIPAGNDVSVTNPVSASLADGLLSWSLIL